jgi:hypothetical protein
MPTIWQTLASRVVGISCLAFLRLLVVLQHMAQHLQIKTTAGVQQMQSMCWCLPLSYAQSQAAACCESAQSPKTQKQQLAQPTQQQNTPKHHNTFLRMPGNLHNQCVLY